MIGVPPQAPAQVPAAPQAIAVDAIPTIAVVVPKSKGRTNIVDAGAQVQVQAQAAAAVAAPVQAAVAGHRPKAAKIKLS